jgi:hypothetical protein
LQAEGAKGGHVLVEEVESKVWCCQVEIKIDQTLVILIRLLNDEFTPFIHGDVETLKICWKTFQGLYKNQNDAKLLYLKVKHVNRSFAYVTI